MALIPKQNLVKASNALFASAGISIVTFIVYLFLPVAVSIAGSLVSTSLLLIFAFFVRAGFEWARYLFALLLIVGVVLSPFTAFGLAAAGSPLVLTIYTIQLILHIYAGVMMFRKRESGYNS